MFLQLSLYRVMFGLQQSLSIASLELFVYSNFEILL